MNWKKEAGLEIGNWASLANDIFVEFCNVCEEPKGIS
jgi:hypothetical protein